MVCASTVFLLPFEVRIRPSLWWKIHTVSEAKGAIWRVVRKKKMRKKNRPENKVGEKNTTLLASLFPGAPLLTLQLQMSPAEQGLRSFMMSSLSWLSPIPLRNRQKMNTAVPKYVGICLFSPLRTTLLFWCSTGCISDGFCLWSLSCYVRQRTLSTRFHWNSD